MRVFLDELRTRHKARLGGLIERHKQGIGYSLLAVGFVIAFLSSNGASDRANEAAAKAERNAQTNRQTLRVIDTKDERTRGVICENSTRTDKQTLANLHTKVDRELIRSLHLTTKQLNGLIHKTLVESARSRVALQPSIPAKACSGKITTLPPPGHKTTKAERKKKAAARKVSGSRGNNSTTTTSGVRGSAGPAPTRVTAPPVQRPRHHTAPAPAPAPAAPAPAAPAPTPAPTPAPNPSGKVPPGQEKKPVKELVERIKHIPGELK